MKYLISILLLSLSVYIFTMEQRRSDTLQDIAFQKNPNQGVDHYLTLLKNITALPIEIYARLVNHSIQIVPPSHRLYQLKNSLFKTGRFQLYPRLSVTSSERRIEESEDNSLIAHTHNTSQKFFLLSPEIKEGKLIGPNRAGLVAWHDVIYDLSKSPITIYPPLFTSYTVLEIHPEDKKWLALTTAPSHQQPHEIVVASCINANQKVLNNLYMLRNKHFSYCKECNVTSDEVGKEIECSHTPLLTKYNQYQQDEVTWGPRDRLLIKDIDHMVHLVDETFKPIFQYNQQPYQINIRQLIDNLGYQDYKLLESHIQSNVRRKYILISFLVYKKDPTEYVAVQQRKKGVILYHLPTHRYTLLRFADNPYICEFSRAAQEAPCTLPPTTTFFQLNNPIAPLYPYTDYARIYNGMAPYYVAFDVMPVIKSFNNGILLTAAAYFWNKSPNPSFKHARKILKMLYDKSIIGDRWELLWRATYSNKEGNPTNAFAQLYNSKDRILGYKINKLAHHSLFSFDIKYAKKILAYAHSRTLFPNSVLREQFKKEHEKAIATIKTKIKMKINNSQGNR